MTFPVLGLVGVAAAVELDERGRWVEEAPIEVGGVRLLLRSGVLFPVDGEGGPAGFVFVGDAAFTAPLDSAGAALAVRAGVPDGPRPGDREWTEGIERVVAVGHHPALLAAQSLGRPLGDDPATLTWIDERGQEQVEVTGLRPREALAQAKAALRSRADALGGVGLDPDRMIALEAHRGGERRAIVEVEPARDLRALVAADDDAADLARPWVTWVVDPAGVVDDRYGSVLAVHGPTPEGRTWRVLSGVARVGPPEVTVTRGTANVVLDRGIGVAARGTIQVQIELAAHAPTRILDLWIPRSETTTREGAIPVGGDPEITRFEARRPGGEPQPVEIFGASFGPRGPREGWLAHTVLLPEPLSDGDALTLRLDSTEDWDLGQILQVPQWVVASLLPPLPLDLGALLQGVPEQITLGRVITDRPVLPVLAADARPYPVELRTGTVVGAWQLTAGAGATTEPQGDGRLSTVSTTSDTTFSGGELEESRDRAAMGFPAVRLLSHTFVDQRIPERVRSVLHFYDTALPAYPHPEIVVLQAPDRPILTVSSARGRVQLREPLRDVVPDIRSLGGGQLALEGLIEVPIGDPAMTQLQSKVDSDWPHALERSLAEAVAAGWWEALPWSDHDRWLARALPALYRDRFVAEAWDEDVVRRWQIFADERIAEGPKGSLAPLVGTDAEWAGEAGARLLGAIASRVGEEALLRGLHRFLDSGEPTLDRMVIELEATCGIALRDTFDAFAVAGLRPRIEGTLSRGRDEITVTLSATPPIGTYDVPLVLETRRGRTVTWVHLVEGSGTATVPARGDPRVEIDPDHLLPVRGAVVRE